MLPKRL